MIVTDDVKHPARTWVAHHFRFRTVNGGDVALHRWHAAGT